MNTLLCVHANNSWCSSKECWGPLSLILSPSLQCKQLTLMFISVDRERKMSEVTMVSSVSLWRSLNDCFKFSSINSLISSQSSLQSTGRLLKDSYSLCHNIFSTHWLLPIQNTYLSTCYHTCRWYSNSSSCCFFYFILTVCVSFFLSMEIYSSVIIHDIWICPANISSLVMAF